MNAVTHSTGRWRWGRWGIGVTFLAILVLGSLDLVQHYDGTNAPAAYLLSAIRALPLLIYRWRPLEAWCLELGAVVGTALVTVPVSPAEPWPWAVGSAGALVAVSGLVASLGDRRLSIVMLGVVTGLGLLLLVVFPSRADWVSVAVTTGLCAVGMVLGDAVHGRRRIGVELAEERQVSAAERERRSMIEERARIARELHDVVAHHMSMITVQAETARYRLGSLPEPVVEEFAGIARVARGSLTELRGLLSALRDDEAEPDRSPQPTLDGLDALAERITAAGTPVRLAIVPDAAALADLPQVVQLAVYRIVQEALSNVVRHAGGAAATVDIERTASALRVTVTNERPAADRTVAIGGAGHGLRGLRERATLLGGTFAVDWPDGGWQVRVELPV